MMHINSALNSYNLIGCFYQEQKFEVQRQIKSQKATDKRAGVLIALDDAHKKLAEFDEEKARLVELRKFDGLSVEETPAQCESVFRRLSVLGVRQKPG